MNINELSLKQALEGLKKRQFSAFDLTKACLKQIKQKDPLLKAFITVTETLALKEAANADRAINKPILNGIPFSIKDVFLTKDIKTTVASNVLVDFIPPYDATVVSKLKKAGVIIIGKTNLDSFCHGSSTETSDFFTTRNPWNVNRLPGGSSGGSAASVAANMTIGSVGTETAGSIRQPASWCGVVGLKPTYGRVSRYGVIAMASSFDSPGPIAKTVEDSALILQAIAGKDEHDATSLSCSVSEFTKNLEKGVKDLKIGVPRQYFLKKAQTGVNETVKKAIGVLEKLGAKLVEVTLMDPQLSVAVYTILQRSEVSSNLARYDGIRFGNNRMAFNEENKKRIMLGTYTLSSGYYDAYYLKAGKMRTLIIKDFENIFKKVDVIAAPTSPCTALPVGSSKKSPMFGEIQDILVEPSSIAGLPGISLPCGRIDNLPVGLQIIGPQFAEELILQVANAYEKTVS